MKIVMATNNKHKIIEMGKILRELGFETCTLADIGLQCDPEETADTFMGNALIKARAVMKASSIAAIADDSGIAVRALGGQPGVYSARYGYPAANTDQQRLMLLLDNMRNQQDRYCEFICAIACVFPDGTEITAEGYLPGQLIREPCGTNGFGYDPAFVPEGYTVTMAQLEPDEKNKISHRGRALKLFKEKMGGDKRC